MSVVDSPRAKDEEPPASAQRSHPPSRLARKLAGNESNGRSAELLVALPLVEQAMKRLHDRMADAAALTLRELERSAGGTELVSLDLPAHPPRQKLRRNVVRAQQPHPLQAASTQPVVHAEKLGARELQAQLTPLTEAAITPINGAPSQSQPVEASDSFLNSGGGRRLGRMQQRSLAEATHDVYRQAPTSCNTSPQQAVVVAPIPQRVVTINEMSSGESPVPASLPLKPALSRSATASGLVSASGSGAGQHAQHLMQPSLGPLDASPIQLKKQASFGSFRRTGKGGSDRGEPKARRNSCPCALQGSGTGRRSSLSGGKALGLLLGGGELGEKKDKAQAMIQAQSRQAQLRERGHDPELMRTLFGSEAHSLLWEEAEPERAPWYLMHPLTWRRFVWDFLISLLIFLTILETPFAVAFLLVPNPRDDLPLSAVADWHKTVNLCIDSVMLFDVILSFFTGYVDGEGYVVMDHRRIVKRYLKGWFAIEFFTSIPVGDVVPVSRAAVRTLRLMRLARLLRLQRLVRYVSRWREDFVSTSASIKLAQLLTAVFIYVHLMACVIYAMPAFQNFPADSWVWSAGLPLTSLPDPDAVFLCCAWAVPLTWLAAP